jgi:hypothetical protein
MAPTAQLGQVHFLLQKLTVYVFATVLQLLMGLSLFMQLQQPQLELHRFQAQELLMQLVEHGLLHLQ